MIEIENRKSKSVRKVQLINDLEKILFKLNQWNTQVYAIQ